MERFTCLGGSCPDTCCSGWRVPIEREAHERLLSLSKGRPALRERLEATADFEAGKPIGSLRFGEDGRCGLLTEGGLCSVHGELGEHALHAVCRIYPRLVTSFGERTEHLGALSCPEVLRLVLDDDESLTFTERDDSAPTPHRHRLSPEDPYAAPLLLVRAALLRLLEDEDDLGARLFTMLYVANQLSEFLKAGAPALPNEAYEELLAALTAPAPRKGLADTWRALPRDELTALNLATQIVFTERAGNARYRTFALEARRTLGLDDETLPLSDAGLAALAAHLDARRRRLSPLAHAEIQRALGLYAKSHLLTNPYVEERTPLRAVFALGLRLATLAVFLAGRATLEAETSQEALRATLVESISAFSRHLEHSEVFSGLLEELDRQDLVALAVGTSLTRLL